MKTLVQWTHK